MTTIDRRPWLALAATAALLAGCGGGGDGGADGDPGDGHAGGHGDHASHAAAGTTAPAPPPGELPESNRRMAERLEALAAAANPRSYAYDNLGRGRLYAQMAEARPLSRDRFAATFQAASELLKGGATEEAIAKVDEAESVLAEMKAAGMPTGDDWETALLDIRALCMLRLGEQENCLENHTMESCLMPVMEGGIHGIERGSRAAVELYSRLLERKPGDLHFRWLLNLAHMTLGEYPDGVDPRHRIPESVFASDVELPRMHDRAGELGIGGMALAGGAIMDDFTGDGRPDLVTSAWGLRDQMRFHVRTADGGFEDRTEAAGLIGQVSGLNMVHADYDGDGDRDVYVLRGGWLMDQGMHPNTLLANDGTGRFTDVTEAAGLLSLRPSQTAAWGDLDDDGDLDLVVGCEPTRSTRFKTQLFLNDGDGTFTESALACGLNADGLVKGVTLGDYDGDGRLDVYCSRFGEANLLFRHEGNGPDGRPRFREVAAQAGVQGPIDSFPAWFFDQDDDGDLDLFVASFTGFADARLDSSVRSFLGDHSAGERCRFYRNRGDGTFADESAAAGVARVLPVMGANYGDLDNDGRLDLYLGTGQPNLAMLVPNVMLRNDGAGGFQDVTTTTATGSVQKGHGIAFGDVDGDGDQDVWVNMGGAYSGDVYPNLLLENPGHGHRWLTLRLVGAGANRDAIGARVRVTVDGPSGSRTIHRVVGTGGSFGSSTLQLEVGLGGASRVSRVEIDWPAPRRGTTVHEDVPMDAVVRVVRDADAGDATLTRVDEAPLPLAAGAGGTGGHDHSMHGGH